MSFRDEVKKVRDELTGEEKEKEADIVTGPRSDPGREPSHRAARIADRERGEERGDVED
jgi:hypothetical protein